MKHWSIRVRLKEQSFSLTQSTILIFTSPVEETHKTLGQERRSQKQALPRSESFAVLLCHVPQMPSISCNYCSPLHIVYTYNRSSQNFHCVCVTECLLFLTCVCVCEWVRVSTAEPVTQCSSHVVPLPAFGRERSNVIRGLNPIWR